MVDYNALAQKFGGAAGPAKPAAPVGGSVLNSFAMPNLAAPMGGGKPDLASLASKYGGKASEGTNMAQDDSQPQEDPTAGSSTGFFNGPLSLLAVPGQLATKVIADVGTKDSQQHIADTAEGWQKAADRYGKMAEVTTDPVEKRKLIDMQAKAAEQIRSQAKMGTGMQQTNLEAQKVKIPYVGEIPALSDNPGRVAQQVAGRGTKTVGMVGSGLGGTLSGALFGLGEGMEENASLKDTAIKTGAYAAGGKFFDFLGNTGVGQKVLNSKFMQGVGKVLSPFMTSAAEEGTAGATVDKVAKNIGESLNRAFSPSAWMTRATPGDMGLLKSPEEKLTAAEDKLSQKYRDVLNPTARQTQMEFKSGKDIGDILTRENVPIESYSESGKIKIDTTKAQGIFSDKSKLENAAFNGVLKDSGEMVNFDEYANSARQAVAQRYDAGEREVALGHLNGELAAWKKQLMGAGAVAGEEGLMVPADQFNRVKQYFWKSTPPSLFKSPEAILGDDVNYLAGTTAKTTIETTVKDANVQAMNQYLGDMAYAQRMLAQANGKVAPGSTMGKYFNRIIGGIAGEAIGGPLGAVGGAMTSDKVAEYMMSPEFKLGGASKLVAELRAQLGSKADDVIEQAQAILEKRAAERAATLKLGPGGKPAVNNGMPIITPAPAPETTFEPKAKMDVRTKTPVTDPLLLKAGNPDASTLNQGRPLPLENKEIRLGKQTKKK